MKKFLIIFGLTLGVLGITAVLINHTSPTFAQTVSTNPTEVAQPQAVAADEVCVGTNLLTNPSFEGEYEPYVMPAPGHPDCQTWHDNEPNQYCERVKVATDWHPYWLNTPRNENWQNIQPEYVPSLPHEQPPRVFAGDKSQHYFSFWSTHEAGFYQQQTAVIGGNYCFSIYGHAWSSRLTLSGFLSDPNDHGYLHQRVGIDPTGGTDWQSPNVIWSDERMQYDEFGVFSIEAVAQTETITVFAYSRADVPVKHNDVYWDEAILTVEKAMAIDTASMALMADDDQPQTLNQTVGISLTAALNWTAVLDPNGTITPTVNLMSGDNTITQIDVMIDTNGLPVGNYSTTLTLIADDPETTGSPFEIPIQVFVVDDIYAVFLPLIVR
ncbi:MAG: hypothetical protein AAF490_14075 [Chloroflexota bacterium]